MTGLRGRARLSSLSFVGSLALSIGLTFAQADPTSSSEPKHAQFTNIFVDAPVGAGMKLNADDRTILGTLIKHRKSILERMHADDILVYMYVSVVQADTTGANIFLYRLGLRRGPKTANDPNAKVLVTDLRFHHAFKRASYNTPPQESWTFLSEEDHTPKEITEEALTKRIPPPKVAPRLIAIAENCDPSFPGHFFICPKESKFIWVHPEIVQLAHMSLRSLEDMNLDELFDKHPVSIAASIKVVQEGFVLEFTNADSSKVDSPMYALSIQAKKAQDGSLSFSAGDINPLDPSNDPVDPSDPVPDSPSRTKPTEPVVLGPPLPASGYKMVQTKGSCQTQSRSGALPLMFLALVFYGASSYRRRASL